MRGIHEISHTHRLHSTFLGQMPAPKTFRQLVEEKATREVTSSVCFHLLLLGVPQTHVG